MIPRDDPEVNPDSLVEVQRPRAKVKPLGEEMKRTPVVLMHEAVRLQEARQNTWKWFDDAVDQVAGWYKRRAYLIILCSALVVSLILDAEAITIANSLFGDATLPTSVVAAAM